MILLLTACGGCGGTPTAPTPGPVTVDDNAPPVIARVVCSPRCQSTPVATGMEITFYAEATDPDGDRLDYAWSVTGGVIVGPDDGAILTWRAPETPGTFEVAVTIDDGRGGSTSFSGNIEVVRKDG